MAINLFKIQSYKRYLSDFIDEQPRKGHGVRSKLARHIGCQTSYLSQILNSKIDMNLEQAELASDFMGHNDEERHVFLLLVQYEKANTTRLKNYFKSQLDEIFQKRLLLVERIKTESEVSENNKAIYYSSWLYSTLHVMLSIKDFDSRTRIAEVLQMPTKKVGEILDFLVSAGIAKEVQGRYSLTTLSLHLPHDSPFISKHHSNWRVQAMASLDYEKSDDVHYSTVFSIAEKDVLKIKSILVDAIAQINSVMKDSPEEIVRTLCVDLFSPI